MTYFHSTRKSEAKMICERWEKNVSEGREPLFGFKVLETDAEIRDDILSIFSELDTGIYGYDFDSKFGLKLYTYLKGKGITESDAANNEFWIHLQLKVVPDILLKRWPMADGVVNNKRLWSSPSRIYFKVLWWYIDLLWAGDENVTSMYLAPVDISQIIDRSGHGGTRKEVYRALLRTYALVPAEQRNNRLIDRVLMLDSTYCTVVEPELMDISLEEYALKIFREVGADV